MKPRRNPRKKPAIPARSSLARPNPASSAPPLKVEQIAAMREMFWQNVMRELLVSLSAPLPEQAPASPDAANSPSQPPAPQPDASLFDGRLAIITKGGERIPIAAVMPLFGCGPNSPATRDLSLAVECTIFQIRTPDGHVFTVPIHEIRCFHALAPEIMERLERAARRRAARRGDRDDDGPPFGFAAFTSLARGIPSQPLEPPPAHPME